MWKEPEHEINELTKRLFAGGYTREHYPDYVDPYNWFYGGFTYTTKHKGEMVFSTPCGLLVDGTHFRNGTMYYMGVQWCVENDNPTVTCPYFDKKEPCTMNHELLRNGGFVSCSGKCVPCACHAVNVPFDYEHSFQKVHDDVWKEADKLFKQFGDTKNGRVCKTHCYYDRSTKQWKMWYDPLQCATERNGACRYCSVLKTEMSSKKGNVYYDEIVTYTEKGKGLFPDKVITTATKGKKLLNHQMSLTLCEAIIKYAKWRILERKTESYECKHRLESINDPNFSVKFINFRAENRETRDLEQDLSDIKEGIEVVHASDQQKAAKAQKRERRNKALEDKKRRLEKRILEVGFGRLDRLETRHYDKWFTGEDEEKIIQKLEVKKELLKDSVTGEQTKLF